MQKALLYRNQTQYHYQNLLLLQRVLQYLMHQSTSKSNRMKNKFRILRSNQNQMWKNLHQFLKHQKLQKQSHRKVKAKLLHQLIRIVKIQRNLQVYL
ncbi:hypothetical protein C1O34_10390 [Staphylococcus schleiferi]|uniref:Uncharacterized protein n=1 Tax=Staphylococcus schleiferi TaxID=1295 RepID=A0ABX0FZK6_STASC|nr:hypothetical protein [Staphylococcus schleiferi]NHA41646.1 hypothetical protein [Staphylococcus schleiferi]